MMCKIHTWAFTATKPGEMLTVGEISSKESNLQTVPTVESVILVYQRGLSSPALNNAILLWPLGTGGRPSEI